MNPVRILSPYFFKIILTLGLPSWLFPSSFPTHAVYTFVIFPLRATCPAYLIRFLVRELCVSFLILYSAVVDLCKFATCFNI
jgi:hypothetical protein